MTKPVDPDLSLSRLFTWVMPEQEEIKPYRVAEPLALVRPMAVMGYRFAVEPPADDSDAERDRWATDYRLCIWTEFAGFDRNGLAQIVVGFRETRAADHADRVLVLAEKLREAVKPWGFKVTVLRRFNRPERILLAG